MKENKLKKDDTWTPNFLSGLQQPNTQEEAEVHDIHP